MIEVPVDLGPRRYPIHIGHGAAALLPELLPAQRGRRVALVTNARVFALHGARVERALRALGPAVRILIPDGEAHKSRETLARVHDAMLRSGLRRDALLVAFGGGVVTDLAGFAAATWMRGIDWVPLPTTLLAMVDSAVGGKVGVNHPKAKNLIGAFHQPRAVVVDPSFLETLPPRELRSGAYEVLKCGVLADRTLFGALQQSPLGLQAWERIPLENAIASACRIKAEIVEGDEREAGRRRLLNLGHTLGHALEAVTRYRRFTHGEAVGWGLIGAAWIARAKGLLGEAAFDAIAAAVDRVGPRPRVSDLRPERLLEALGRDKKARGARRVFVLPTAIGRAVVREDVTDAEVRRALRVMAAREALLG
ncbi:MAG TPA: 3-dehydroquinate synthase [Vicinamibacteria bacterium]|nr:3-dehydroquinate synthase [Vicinamibacteria bacterium]